MQFLFLSYCKCTWFKKSNTPSRLRVKCSSPSLTSTLLILAISTIFTTICFYCNFSIFKVLYIIYDFLLHIRILFFIPFHTYIELYIHAFSIHSPTILIFSDINVQCSYNYDYIHFCWKAKKIFIVSYFLPWKTFVFIEFHFFLVVFSFGTIYYCVVLQKNSKTPP